MALNHSYGRIVKRGDWFDRQARAKAAYDAGMPEGILISLHPAAAPLRPKRASGRGDGYQLLEVVDAVVTKSARCRGSLTRVSHAALAGELKLRTERVDQLINEAVQRG